MKKKLLFSALLLFSTQHAFTQLTVTPFGPGSPPITSFLAGTNLSITNVVVSGDSGAIGTFDGTNSNLGMGIGMVMSTGFIQDLTTANISTSTSGTTYGVSGDTLMDNLCGSPTFDGIFLDFDVTPQFSNILFNFIFGSEEYPEFVGSFNDGFAIFFSGPGFPQQNVAWLPGNTTTVTVNNVNATTNPTYYIANDPPYAAPPIELDGFTTNLTVLIPGLVAGNTYHFRIGAADNLDQVFDTGVFLQAASFRSADTTTSAATPQSLFVEIAGNPSPGLLDMRLKGLPQGNSFSYSLTNPEGKAVYVSGMEKANGNRFTRDHSDLPPGIYLLAVQAGGETLCTRWMKK